jgi:hypothetical protein
VVEDHSRRTVKYLNEAVQVGRHHAGRMHEWRRLVLYALIDAVTHNYPLVGTLAAYLQQEGTDDDLIRRYLQSPDPGPVRHPGGAGPPRRAHEPARS